MTQPTQPQVEVRATFPHGSSDISDDPQQPEKPALPVRLIIQHIRNPSVDHSLTSLGGAVTVCYQLPDRPSNTLLCSFAWATPNEVFNKKVGSAMAKERWLGGQVSLVRLPLRGMYADQLRLLYSPFLQPALIEKILAQSFSAADEYVDVDVDEDEDEDYAEGFTPVFGIEE